MESITSIATSDSKRLISSSNKTDSISFSFSSFSLNPFETSENAFFRLSNIVYFLGICDFCIIFCICCFPISKLSATCFLCELTFCNAISNSFNLDSSQFIAEF